MPTYPVWARRLEYFLVGISMFWATEVLSQQSDDRLPLRRDRSPASSSVYAAPGMSKLVRRNPAWYSNPAVLSAPKPVDQAKPGMTVGDPNVGPALRYNRFVPHDWLF